MEKSSHGGMKMAEACDHLKSMQAEHGVPAAAGSRSENENKASKSMERKSMKDMRKEG